MKRFVWRLQKVLDIKTKEEQFRRMELFRLTEALAERRAELLMRQRILQEKIDDVARVPLPDRVKAQELFLRYATTNDRYIRELQNDIRNLEMRQKEKIQEVLTAKRFKEGLERLRTEAEAQYIQEQEKLEQKESDDRTTVAFARNEGMGL